MLMDDEPEVAVLPPPQMQRHGPRFIPVPTLPVFGPGTEPLPTADGEHPPLPIEVESPLNELPQPEGVLPPTAEPQNLPPQGGYPRGTTDRIARGTQAEPARLKVPGQGSSWTFHPARAAPLGRDQRFTLPPLRSMPRPPAKAMQ